MRLSRVKAFIIIILLLVSVLVGCGIKETFSNKEGVSIYLVKNMTVAQAMKTELKDIPLEQEPLFTNKEIKAYYWKQHTVYLKGDFSLEAKLEGQVPLSGKAFVLMVGDERVYLGSFWNMLSSLYNPEIPTIYSGWFKESKTNNYRIQCNNAEDPRNDNRLYEALKNLGILIDK